MNTDESLKIIVDGCDLSQMWNHMSLVDKIISYECGIQNIGSFEQLRQFWQELIDRGICWHSEMHPHYARVAHSYISRGVCTTPVDWVLPPEVPQDIGADEWDRPPQHEDWGRPLRWKQLRKERLRIVKAQKRKFEETGERPSSCCKGGSS